VNIRRVFPKGWASAPLGDVLPIVYGKALRSNNRSVEGDVPVYGSNGIVGTHNTSITTGPAVIVGRKGAAGAVHFCVRPCWVIDTAYFASAFDVLDARFATYLLRHTRLSSLDRSTAIPSLSRDDYNNLVVPIPPLCEQKRIAAKLDELLSDVDDIVASLERSRGKLKRYRAAVLKAAVEGKLTAEWRKANPNVEPADKLLERILTERRGKWEQTQLAKYAPQGKQPPVGWRMRYSEPVRPSLGDLPRLPNTWGWVSLDSIADVAGGITKGQKRLEGAKIREVPYLRVANVQRGYLDLSVIKTIPATEAEISELRLVAGDVLFNEGGDRDKLGRGWVWSGEIENCVHQNHVFRARPIIRDLQSKYISHHGNTFGKEWFQRNGKQSVNLASINLNVLKRFPIPLPPIAEQIAIVQELEDRISTVDKAEAQIASALAKAASLRQAILKRAFEGRLVPQDPNDEPASVLLERIRAQRAQDARPKARSARTRAAAAGLPRQRLVASGGPRMLTEAEREALRRDKAESLRLLQELYKRK
jgi:type I restriction enzyme S subunit